jgi:predicted DNA binding protein
MRGAGSSPRQANPGRRQARSRAREESAQAERLRRLRRQDPAPSRERLFLATLRIRIPDQIWNGPFTAAHPNVRLEALNRTDVRPGESVSDYWISGLPAGLWALEISRFPDVTRVESLAEVGDGCLYRIAYRDPPILALYRRLQLPLQLPLRMQGGYVAWEVAARYSEFQEILAHARAADPNVSIVSIRRRPLRSHLPLLTEAQHELLTQAMAAGYFAVPRGITLTALARKLERSKSSTSEALAHIEKKLFETALRPASQPL